MLLPVPPPTRQGPRGKPVTRRTVLSRRDAMTANERAAASELIAERASQLIAGSLQSGAAIALYAPKGSEVDTALVDASARARGLRVAYPRVVDGDRRLELREATPEALVPSRFGLREPVGGEVVAIAEIAAFVVPGLAFDRAGWRIGWGRGHYDATLAAATPSALRIGLAFECQLIDEVPHDPHDARLHYVVTEAATYRTPE